MFFSPWTFHQRYFRRHLTVVLALCVAQALCVSDKGFCDAPASGFTIPKADSKTVDHLDDLDRYIGKKQWELAFRAVDAVSTSGKGMVPAGSDDASSGTGKGFLFPIARRLRQRLEAMPPEGREAYRLFNDAAAKRLWESTQGAASPSKPFASDDAAALRQIVDRYFLTSVGDLAADRLGDALFEQGNFQEALSAWQLIVDGYPDPHVQVLKVQLKECLVLAQMHRREELQRMIATVKDQGADQKVTFGGQETSVGAFTDSLMAGLTDEPTGTSVAMDSVGSEEWPVIWTNPQEPTWRIAVADTKTLSQMDEQIMNMGWGTNAHFVGSTSPAAIDGKRIYVNWMGVTYAADMETGKMLWRTGKFSEVASGASMFPQYGADPDTFDVSAGGGKVFTLGFDSKSRTRTQYGANVLQCLDGETGKVVWKGDKLGMTVLTTPRIIEGAAYMLGVKDQQDLQLTVVDPENGHVLWSVSLGKPDGANNPYSGSMVYARPAILYDDGTMYIATNNGAMLSVDTRTHSLSWAFRNDAKVTADNEGYYNATPRTFEAPCTLLKDNGVLYIKDTGAASLYAIDPEKQQLLWRRPVSGEEMLMGIQGHTAYLLGQGISAMDMTSRELLWSTKIPEQTGLIRPLMTPQHLYIPSKRGIYDIDPSNGDVLHIYRSPNDDAPGGRLFLADDKLLYVTDSTVTAYTIQRATAAR